MINLRSITNQSNKKHDERWPYIPDHRYRILIIRSGKMNILLYLTKEQNDVDKIYLYAKDLSKPKNKLLIEKCKNVGTKHLNDLNAFIECSNTMDDVIRILMITTQAEKEKF